MLVCAIIARDHVTRQHILNTLSNFWATKDVYVCVRTYKVCVYVCVLFIVFDEMEPVNHFKANIVAKIAVSLFKKNLKGIDKKLY